MKKRLVVLQKITQRTEEENKELTSLFKIFSTRLLTPISSIRYKRESGGKEEEEGKVYTIDDVGVIDFNLSFSFFS